jgi:hypothetical protein
MKKTFLLFSFSGIAATPLFASASTIGTIMDEFLWVILDLIDVFSVAAFVAFFYGLAMFLLSYEDKTAKEKGKNIMVYGILALFVMVTIWGIIGFMQDTLGNYYGPGQLYIVAPQF